MGAANSKVEEDKALQLCRERKKFVKQALEGRCSLAEAHVAYVHSLKAAGTALRKFVEPEAQNESSLYCTSTSATPEPLVLTEKSLSQFSVSSPSVLHRVEATETAVSPSPSTPTTSRFRADHMKFRGSFPKEVEERVSSPATGTVIISSTPPNTTPRSADTHDSSLFDHPPIPPETPPWDYFGLFHPIDHQFSSQEGKRLNSNRWLEHADELRRLREAQGIPDLEDDEEKACSSSHGTGEETQDSENEFDEPSTVTLVRKFENVNRVSDQGIAGSSPSTAVPPVGSVASETEFLNAEGGGSPSTSSLRDGSPVVTPLATKKKELDKEDRAENNIEPKDFVTSIKHIELLFVKASDSGKEVQKMLEANKLQISPIIPANKSVSLASVYLRACFSCGQERRQVQEEPAQAAIKYLTWHNMASSSSPSSSNPLELSSKDSVEVKNGNLFNDFCMVSGSHASTLDRLYAWERKLYDEVKDLYSRIGVAIHRIETISKKIEEVRDKELQPQLEELIEGLSRMWEVMFECHKLQYRIIAVAHHNTTKITVHSESRRQIILLLENELSYLSASFTKWTGAQQFYLWAINSWLNKCVSLRQMPSKRKKRVEPPPLRNFGPPIYATCDVWLSKLRTLPSKEVADVIRALASETRKFLPRQEKSRGKGTKRAPTASSEADNVSEAGPSMSRDDAPEDPNFTFDRFRSRLVGFLGKLNEYSESSVFMYEELKGEIEQAKNNYDRLMSRSQT
ncbi:protein ALTERED PHOSPHATE STARVATION RESPONSE 1-like isoform X2 [Punica granatum]|uniref:Protein ALTERED PHOSPHATE STARVATION RESPONSE 1-like isoform X2 n=1 Tax=Punica granatum TaxID=22663 RepID=A0A6P8CVU5_PUNGR|nr:protein ALTERED PHOSPHATE STARVATION RESPONSE 1-like isoform X2 [Punica granatum]